MRMGDLADSARAVAPSRPSNPPEAASAQVAVPAKASPPAPWWGPAPQGLTWIVLESKLLDGEHVLVVFEKRWLKEARQAHPGKVIYFPPEVDELARFKDDPDTLKLLHRIKKEFGGWIVPSNSPQAVNMQKGGRRHERR